MIDNAASLHMKVIAAFCLTTLFGVTAWQVYSYFRPKTDVFAADTTGGWMPPEGDKSLQELAKALGLHSGPASTEEIAAIGTSTMEVLVEAYATLSENGMYTPEAGKRIAQTLASNIEVQVPYSTFEEASVKTSADVSYHGMVAYRTKLQKSLSPLLENTKYELALYNEYMETHSPLALADMKSAASRYLEAAELTTRVSAPVDAVRIHAGIVNALRQFGTTLNLVADNIDNPITSLSLLVSYSKSEQAMADAFSALDAYYASKQP